MSPSCCRLQGVQLPPWQGQQLDPWVFHDAVRRRGGYERVRNTPMHEGFFSEQPSFICSICLPLQVTYERRWKDIGRCLGTAEDDLDAGTTAFFKQAYSRYIAPFLDSSLAPPSPDDPEEVKLHRKGRFFSNKRASTDDSANQQNGEAHQQKGSASKPKGGKGTSKQKLSKRKTHKTPGRKARFTTHPPPDDDEDDIDMNDVASQEDEDPDANESGDTTWKRSTPKSSKVRSTQRGADAKAKDSTKQAAFIESQRQQEQAQWEQGKQHLQQLAVATGNEREKEHAHEEEADEDEYDNDEEEERETAFRRSGEIALQRGEDENVVSGARGLAKAVLDLKTGHSDHLCEVCGGGGAGDKMVLCDRCDRGFHAFCLTPELDELPDDAWYCHECTQTIHCLHRLGAEPKGETTLDQILKHSAALRKRFMKAQRPCDISIREYLQMFWSIVDTDYSGTPVEVLYGEEQEKDEVCEDGSSSENDANLPSFYQSSSFPLDMGDVARSRSSLMYHVPQGAANEAERSIRIGNLFSTVGWGFEPMNLPSLNCLHWGEQRMWYSVGPDNSREAENAVYTILQRSLQAHPHLVYKREALPPPHSVEEASNTKFVHSVVQEQGTLIMTVPGAFTGCIDLGVNVSEKAYIAQPALWLPFADDGLSRLQVLHVSPPFSLSHVIWCAAQSISPNEALGRQGYWLGVELANLLRSEADGRHYALEGGVVHSRTADGDWNDDSEWCCVCGSDLWGSQVMCMRCDPDRRVCLKHVEALCDCNPDPNHVLIYRRSLAELQETLETLLTERRRTSPPAGNKHSNVSLSLELDYSTSSKSLEDEIESLEFAQQPPDEAVQWISDVENAMKTESVDHIGKYQRLVHGGERYIWGGKEMEPIRRMHNKLSNALSWAYSLPWPEGGCTDNASLEVAKQSLSRVDAGDMPLALAGLDLIRERINAASYAESRAHAALETWPRREKQLADAAEEGERCVYIQTPLCCECRRLLEMTASWRKEAHEILTKNADPSLDHDVSESCKVHVDRVKELLEQEQCEGLPLQSWEVEAARACMREASQFSARVESVMAQPNPELSTFESLLNEAAHLKVRPPAWHQLACIIDECCDWRNRAKMWLHSSTSSWQPLDMLFREGLCLPARDTELLRQLYRAKEALHWSERHQHLFLRTKSKRVISLKESVTPEDAQKAIAHAEEIERKTQQSFSTLCEVQLPELRLHALRDYVHRSSIWTQKVQPFLKHKVVGLSRNSDNRLTESTLEALMAEGKSLGTATSKEWKELMALSSSLNDWKQRAQPLLKTRPPTKKYVPFLGDLKSAESLLHEARQNLAVKPRDEDKLEQRADLTRQWAREAKEASSLDTEDVNELQNKLQKLESLKRRMHDLYFDDEEEVLELKRRLPGIRAEVKAKKFLSDGGTCEEAENLLSQNLVRTELKEQLEEQVSSAKDWSRRVRSLLRSDRTKGLSTIEDARSLLAEGEALLFPPTNEIASLSRAINAHDEWYEKFEATLSTLGQERLDEDTINRVVTERDHRAKHIASELYDEACSVSEEAKQWRASLRNAILRPKQHVHGYYYTAEVLPRRAVEYLLMRTDDALEALMTTRDKYMDEEEPNEANYFLNLQTLEKDSGNGNIGEECEECSTMGPQVSCEKHTASGSGTKSRDASRKKRNGQRGHSQKMAVQEDEMDEILEDVVAEQDVDSIGHSRKRTRPHDEDDEDDSAIGTKKRPRKQQYQQGYIERPDEHLVVLEGLGKGRYCLCRGPDFGTPMLMCDECGKWYHNYCAGIRGRETAQHFKCSVCCACVDGNLLPLERRQAALASRTVTRQPSNKVLSELLQNAKELRVIPHEESKLIELLKKDAKFRSTVAELWNHSGPVLVNALDARKAKSAFVAAFATEVPPFDEVGYLAWLAFGNAWREKQAKAAFRFRRPSFQELGEVSYAAGIGRCGMMEDHIGQELEELFRAAYSWLTRAQSCLQKNLAESVEEARDLVQEAEQDDKLQRVDLGAELLSEVQRRGERHCLCREPQGDLQMIHCDSCNEWFHAPCVGLDDATLAETEWRDLPYHCPRCCEANGIKYTVGDKEIEVPEYGSVAPSKIQMMHDANPSTHAGQHGSHGRPHSGLNIVTEDSQQEQRHIQHADEETRLAITEEEQHEGDAEEAADQSAVLQREKRSRRRRNFAEMLEYTEDGDPGSAHDNDFV